MIDWTCSLIRAALLLGLALPCAGVHAQLEPVAEPAATKPENPPEPKPAEPTKEEPKPADPKPPVDPPPGDKPAETMPPKPPVGKLPWETPKPRLSEPILRPLEGPREILERYDIGPSQLDGFFNGEPLGQGEDDVLAKILFRFPRMALENIERWRKKDVTWDQLAANPGQWRAEFFAIRGRAKMVEKHTLLPELAVLYEFDHYYRTTIDLDDSPYQALVCSRRVPQAWKVGELIDEPAACDGLFLKLGDQMADEPQLVFASRRVAWFPDRPAPKQFVGPDQLQLAAWGLDIGLLDDVRATNRQGIGDADREAFYQMLAALGRADRHKLRRNTPQPLDIVPLLAEPESQHGQFITVEGTARRVMKVPVPDADVQKRFGIDHYYEIDLFLPLGDKTLRFGKDKTGVENPVYANNFPATLICRQLPPGMREGDDLRDPLRADAVFFKLWTYRSGYSSQFGQLQPAPLFVAIEPKIVPHQPLTNWVSGILVSFSFGLAILVIVVFFVWSRGSGKRYADPISRELHNKDGRPPDFSGLDGGSAGIQARSASEGLPTPTRSVSEGLATETPAPQPEGPAATNAIQ